MGEFNILLYINVYNYYCHVFLFGNFKVFFASVGHVTSVFFVLIRFNTSLATLVHINLTYISTYLQLLLVCITPLFLA